MAAPSPYSADLVHAGATAGRSDALRAVPGCEAIALRAARAEDDQFLRALFHADRGEQFMPLNLPTSALAGLLEFKGNGTARVRAEYVGRAPIEGSDDTQLMATLRTGIPAPAPSLVRVASAKPFVPDMSSVPAGRPVRGEIPMPQGRPYTLGNTSADMASIGATSEMSASSRTRGRAPVNSRAVAYDADGNDVSSRASAYAPDDGAGEAREILSGRGLS